MKRTSEHLVILVIATVLCAGAIACGSQDLPDPIDLVGPSQRPNDAFTIRGTVELVQVEGGCWTILTNEGRYEPLELPAAYRQDGLEVLAEVAPRTDLASICQVGPIVALLRLEAI